MKKETKYLITKLSIIESRLTRFRNFLEQAIDESDTIEVQNRLESVKPCFSEFEDVFYQIVALENGQVHESQLLEFENKYHKALADAQKLISHNSPNSACSSATNDSSSAIKLPDIKLPSFSGSFVEWITFRDGYKSLIHDNKTLNNIQKFHYLHSSIHGEALQTIEHLTASGDNYAAAWKLLEERFENKRLIAQHHIRAIFSVHPVHHKDAKSFRQTLHTVTANLKALESLQRPVKQWDDLLVFLITSKFDHPTMLAWESSLDAKIPTLDQLIHFITQRCQMLEALESNVPKAMSQLPNKLNKQTNLIVQQNTNRLNTNNSTKCGFCKSVHHLYQCQKFLDLSPEQRLNEVRRLRLCKNCLRSNHKTDQCLSSNCKNCGHKHNSLLHLEEKTTPVVSHLCAQLYERRALLSTAIVAVQDQHDNTHHLRAILDSGSQNHFITRNACKKLGLPMIKTHLPVVGIAKSEMSINRALSISVKSTDDTFQTKLSCLVIPEISLNHPQTTFDAKTLNIPRNIKLADPQFNISRNVDLLIGTELFWDIILSKQIRPNGQKGPILQETKFGFIVAAVLCYDHKRRSTICNLAQFAALNKQLEKFWEIEDYAGEDNGKLSQTFCERHYQDNVERNSAGRFIVRLPFKNDPPNLGNSKQAAIKRFLNLESKLLKEPEMRKQYQQFMNEYVNLGHMNLVSKQELTKIVATKSFYLPHHAVIKAHSTTTKLRVVFDGSAKTTNSQSLNDHLLVGPPLQQELFSILTRFRTHKYVISGDIAKMYRQILIHPNDRDYQLILWRNNPRENISTYRLNTVTYGLACAPFLAIRSLQELAAIEAKTEPTIKKIILRDFYVDDVLTGANTIEKTLEIRDKLIQILAKGGFELRKIASNSRELAPRLNNSESHNVNLDMQTCIKTLGVHWDSQSDRITFAVTCVQNNTVTIRNVLSLISKLFDPLGLVSLVTITAKILLQKIWIAKCDWDEEITGDVREMWFKFLRDFPKLNCLSIPRNVLTVNSENIEMHGFSDASQLSYGACVYLKTITKDGKHFSQLLCSKNRVAPLKTMTIPRLELCAALLLTKLMHKLRQDLELSISRYFYWTDSSIVLAWIQTESSLLKTFVAHRVAEIQNLSEIDNWHHVKTMENPADILSRGMNAEQLISSKLWWHGPNFLKSNFNTNQKPKYNISETLPELKSKCCLNVAIEDTQQNFNLLFQFSSFNKLLRVSAYCLRFINNSRPNANRHYGQLSRNELHKAEITILKRVQAKHFLNDIHNIQTHKSVSSNTNIHTLHPFLDEWGLLRVGGRLKNANISYDERHQILLPRNHFVTQIIIKHHHKLNLHAGCQATLASIRRKFWPISGTNEVKRVIRTCMQCQRNKPIPYQQLMGDLPGKRVTPSRPFSCTGVDYAGPITLKNGHGRTKKTIKGYIVIFVCFATRACHIELVCDYTAATFLNAFKRFIARRGNISEIHSDNGTNFVGANNQLQKLLKSNEFNTTVIHTLANQRVTWHFIPPKSPHMGGLWEAAVKSTKFHLKRVIGQTLLNYEEMITILVMIEACLNSRPLYPLSNDPSDLQPLTPGHFLIGEALSAPPEVDTTDVQMNLDCPDSN